MGKSRAVGLEEREDYEYYSIYTFSRLRPTRLVFFGMRSAPDILILPVLFLFFQHKTFDSFVCEWWSKHSSFLLVSVDLPLLFFS